MLLRILAMLTLLLAVPASPAPAASTAPTAKTFAVSPFAIHGPDKYRYLSQGIQSMLVTRLSRPGSLEAADTAKVRQAVSAPVESGSRAGEALKSLGVDYLVWGSTTIVGDDASLDVHVAGKDGEAFTTKETAPVSGLIPSLEKVAAGIADGLFKQPAATLAATATPSAGAVAASPGAPGAPGGKPGPKGPAAPANPFIVPAEGRDQSPVNPNFRQEPGAQAEDAGRWRSRSLPYLAQFMAIADIDGDKQNDIILAEARMVHWLKREGDDIREVSSLELPLHFQVFRVSSYDWDRSGRSAVILSGWRADTPEYVVVGARDGKLEVLSEGARQHVTVRRLPPDMRPVLLAQKKSSIAVFDSAGIHRAQPAAGGLELGGRLTMPKGVNLFNFAWLPGREGLKLVVIGKGERLQTYNDKGDQLAETDDSFNGTSIGIEVDDTTMPGMGQQKKSKREDFSQYFPMPLVSLDLYGDGDHVLLANKNVSTAAQFLDRYRNFSQGEIQCLKWDGVNLKLLWKTETIRGQVAGYDVADIDNDGGKELVVAVNSFTGTFGTGGRTVLVAYSLNLPAAKGN